MKKISFILAFLFTVLWAAAQNDNDKPYMVKSFNSSNFEKLVVSTFGGGINVKGNNSKTAQVKVFVKKNNNYFTQGDKNIEDELAKYIIDIGVANGELVCTAKRREEKSGWSSNNLSISFVVDVPSQIDTELKTSGGGITLANLDGNLMFKTSGGGLNLSGLSGNIDGKTSGGGIKVSDSEGKLNLKTSGGGISAKNSKGEINLYTSGGGIDLANLTGTVVAYTSGGGIDVNNTKGNLDIKTSGGSIDLMHVKGDISAKTSGGSIDAKIDQIGEYLNLSTSAGNVKVDLPFGQGMDLDLSARTIKSTKLAKVSGNLQKGKVKGKINGGGSEVKITTSTGNIYID